MKFYYICTELFKFEFKKYKENNKLNTRNMNPKNAIRMINIQKSYSVHIGSIWSILSSLAQFDHMWSYLDKMGFCPFWAN